jgi:hypothetical protein
MSGIRPFPDNARDIDKRVRYASYNPFVHARYDVFCNYLQYCVDKGIKAEEFVFYLQELQLAERLNKYYRDGNKSNSTLRNVIPEDQSVYLVSRYLYENVCHDDELLGVLLPLHPPIIEIMSTHNFNYNVPFMTWITRNRLHALRLLFHYYALDEWDELVTKQVEEHIARQGSTDILDILLHEGYIPSIHMLSESVSYESVDIFDRLIYAGLSVNGNNDDSFILELAALKNSITMLRRLVMYGINLHSSHGVNALLLAINSGFDDFVEELLAYGVRADKSGEEGYPFFAALHAYSSLRVLRLLIENGVDFQYEDKDGRTLSSVLQGIDDIGYRRDVDNLLLTIAR